ncbi:MAG TPA: hypothetical protein VKA27_03720, partial [Sunxiuqinia sp.]|nr:hypothetical protein [Sunxiuqinia sp.]
NTHPQLGKHAFFIDQALHLIVITVVVLLFNRYFELDPLFGIPVKAKYLLIVAGYIFCAKPANIFIKGIFNAFEVQTTNTGNVDLPNAGKLIGIIERFLVLTFIILNQFQAVGFLIAAKSILRFKDDLKAEYVLIGTMLSFALAIGMGILINQF